jgi:hypothetical protein
MYSQPRTNGIKYNGLPLKQMPNILTTVEPDSLYNNKEQDVVSWFENPLYRTFIPQMTAVDDLASNQRSEGNLSNVMIKDVGDKQQLRTPCVIEDISSEKLIKLSDKDWKYETRRNSNYKPKEVQFHEIDGFGGLHIRRFCKGAEVPDRLLDKDEHIVLREKEQFEHLMDRHYKNREVLLRKLYCCSPFIRKVIYCLIFIWSIVCVIGFVYFGNMLGADFNYTIDYDALHDPNICDLGTDLKDRFEWDYNHQLLEFRVALPRDPIAGSLSNNLTYPVRFTIAMFGAICATILVIQPAVLALFALITLCWPVSPKDAVCGSHEVEKAMSTYLRRRRKDKPNTPLPNV